MPYDLKASEARYFCPNCRVWYGPHPSRQQIACLVQHPPGSCCHYAERIVDAPSTEQEPAPGARAGGEVEGER